MSSDDGQYFQGDLMFVRLNGSGYFHQDFRCESDGDGQYILATGEKTGHRHTIQADGVTVYEPAGVDGLFIKVGKKVTVSHDEHPDLKLEPGMYHMTQQREYDYQLRLRGNSTRRRWD